MSMRDDRLHKRRHAVERTKTTKIRPQIEIYLERTCKQNAQLETVWIFLHKTNMAFYIQEFWHVHDQKRKLFRLGTGVVMSVISIDNYWTSIPSVRISIHMHHAHASHTCRVYIHIICNLFAFISIKKKKKGTERKQKIRNRNRTKLFTHANINPLPQQQLFCRTQPSWVLPQCMKLLQNVSVRFCKSRAKTWLESAETSLSYMMLSFIPT